MRNVMHDPELARSLAARVMDPNDPLGLKDARVAYQTAYPIPQGWPKGELPRERLTADEARLHRLAQETSQFHRDALAVTKEGMSIRAIARTLHVSPSTMDYHRAKYPEFKQAIDEKRGAERIVGKSRGPDIARPSEAA